MVEGDYGSWTIGVTDDPGARKAQHGNPLNWCHWKAESADEAGTIEQHFLDKGMKNGTRPGDLGAYVYVF